MLRRISSVAESGYSVTNIIRRVGMRLTPCFETELRSATVGNDFLLRFVGTVCLVFSLVGSNCYKKNAVVSRRVSVSCV